MAHAILLNPDVVASLTDQVLDSLPVSLQSLADSITLGDTFEVWTLSKLSNGSDSMDAAATKTNSYHHQLLERGTVVGFARSQPSNDGRTREITRVVRSPLAERISDALPSIERLVPGDEIARLVSVPQYQVVLVLVCQRRTNRTS